MHALYVLFTEIAYTTIRYCGELQHMKNDHVLFGSHGFSIVSQCCRKVPDSLLDSINVKDTVVCFRIVLRSAEDILL